MFAKTLLSHCQISHLCTTALIAQKESCGHRSQSPACNTRNVLTYRMSPPWLEHFPTTGRTETSPDCLLHHPVSCEALLMHFMLPSVALGASHEKAARGNSPRARHSLTFLLQYLGSKPLLSKKPPEKSGQVGR